MCSRPPRKENMGDVYIIEAAKRLRPVIVFIRQSSRNFVSAYGHGRLQANHDNAPISTPPTPPSLPRYERTFRSLSKSVGALRQILEAHELGQCEYVRRANIFFKLCALRGNARSSSATTRKNTSQRNLHLNILNIEI